MTRPCLCGADDCPRCFPKPRRERDVPPDLEERQDDYSAWIAERVYEAELKREVCDHDTY